MPCHDREHIHASGARFQAESPSGVLGLAKNAPAMRTNQYVAVLRAGGSSGRPCPGQTGAHCTGADTQAGLVLQYRIGTSKYDPLGLFLFYINIARIYSSRTIYALHITGVTMALTVSPEETGRQHREEYELHRTRIIACELELTELEAQLPSADDTTEDLLLARKRLLVDKAELLNSRTAELERKATAEALRENRVST